MQEADHGHEHGRPGRVEEGNHALAREERLDVGESPVRRPAVAAAAPEPGIHAGVDRRAAELALEPVADPGQELAPDVAQEPKDGGGAEGNQGEEEEGLVRAAAHDPVEDFHHVDGADQHEQIEEQAEGTDRPQLPPHCGLSLAQQGHGIVGPEFAVCGQRVEIML